MKSGELLAQGRIKPRETYFIHGFFKQMPVLEHFRFRQDEFLAGHVERVHISTDLLAVDILATRQQQNAGFRLIDSSHAQADQGAQYQDQQKDIST